MSIPEIPEPTKEHRDPLPAPFPVGTRLRYIGTEHLPNALGRLRNLGFLFKHGYIKLGDEVVIWRAHDGVRGGVGINSLDDGWGPAWIERETQDGVSTIAFEPKDGDYGHLVDGKRIHTISEADRDQWEVVAP